MRAHTLLPILLLVSVAFPCLGLAQTPRERSDDVRRVPQEREDMPYMPRLFTVTSPAMVTTANGYTSYQVNVDSNGNNILNDAANEPSLAINPLNPSQIAVGWRQFDTVNSNFRQAGYGWSADGGVTWRSGKFDAGVFRSDPVLAVAPSGQFQYNSLLNTFFTDQWGSSDGGRTWLRLGPSTGGDKQWMIIDNVPGSPGRGFAYQAWSTAGNNYGGRQFSRSTNGGSTWSNPINLPNSPVWGTMDVLSNGDLLLCGTDFGSTFYFLRSNNAKFANQTPTFTSRVVNMGGSIDYYSAVNPGGLSGQAWIAADRSGGPTNGNIYMLCSVFRNSANPLDVHFVRSTDGGTTWSAPRRVNDDPQGRGKYHWFGSLSVAPNGRIDVCWYDTRNSANNTQSQLFYTYSLDGGLTFAPNIAVSQPFSHGVGYPQQDKLGDYIQMVSDDRAANIAYAATFTGGQDVYFVRVVPPIPTDVFPASFSFLRGQQVSGGLGDLFAADQRYLVARPGLILNSGEQPVQLVVQGVAPSTAPSAFAFKAVTKATTTALAQQIALFNFRTGQYEALDTRPTTLVDQTVVVNASGDLRRFVDQGSGEIRVKLGYLQTGPITTFPWQVSFDQTVWTVTP